MKQTYLASIMLLLGYAIQAQQVISTSGDFHSNGSGSISFTIGESMTETFVGSGQQLTQGFQQSKLTITAIPITPEFTLKISAYPNPTTDFLNISIEKVDLSGIRYTLYSLDGKILESQEVKSNLTVIPFSALPPACYFIKITVNSKESKTYKIIKTL
jgi:hypothetical protein